jgi:hypothetical protein
MGRAPIVRRALALLAAAFGIATLAAGTRVWLGADPGYVVYRPLLVFNTAMSAAYLGAALLAWRGARAAVATSWAVFAANLAMLGWIGALARDSGAVATTSLAAMSLRTGFWLVVALGLAWCARREGRYRISSPRRA